jgi:ATP-binding cassette subfamily C protein
MFITSLLWAISIVSPYISGVYVDYLISHNPLLWIVYFLLAFGFINIINIVVQYFTAIVTTKLKNTMLYEIINNINQKIFKSQLSIFKKYDKAYLIDQIGEDSATIVAFFSENISTPLLQFITIIVCASVVFRSDILLGVIVITLIPIYIITYSVFRKKLYSINLEYKKESNKYFSKRSEQVNKLEFIKRNSVSTEMRSRLYKAFLAMFNIANKQVRVNYFFSNLNQIFIMLCYMCVIGIGGYKVYTNQLSVGHFTIINTYFSMIITSTSFFLSLVSSYQNTKVSVDRLKDIFKQENEEIGDVTIDTLKTITVKNLNICFDSRNILDEEFSYTFRSGNMYAIVGANGVGKTTLINCILGLYNNLIDGEIFFDNIPIKKLNMPELRRKKISYIEQFPEFLNLSIHEYLQFGIDKDERTDIRMDTLISYFEVNGLCDGITRSVIINESGNNFSGGEKQKFSIIRSLCKNSFLMILDEPTSSLDTNTTEKLLDLLTKEKNERLTIIVTHDKRILERCDAIIQLNEKSDCLCAI